MNIRTASFRDLARIEQLHRETAAQEESEGVVPGLTPGGDSPVPQTALVRLWYAVSKSLSALMPIADQGDALYVAEDPQQGIVGFVQAQKVPGGARSWQILNLCVSAGRGHFAAAPLLHHLMEQGMSHGVHRFFVRVPLDHPIVSLFLEQGFTQYATEQILFRDDSGAAPHVMAGDAAGALRPARREDVAAVYLLYLRTTPSHVANLEGPTQKAWQDAFQMGWLARIGKDDIRHLVAESPGVVAWAAIRPPSQARPATVALMCEGQDAALREEVVDAALAQLQPGPVSCVLRHYDSELIRSLQKRGFEIYGTQLLLVRDLALKARMRAAVEAKKHVLIQAGLARSVVRPPAPPRPSVHHTEAPPSPSPLAPST